jgi:Transposase C of IS166 homeodomain
MRFDLANLPTDTATLHQIIAAQAAEGEAREAELAAAKAGLMAKALEVEKLKLQIARLRRMQFGRSSEKIARTIEQLELRLEELEAEEPTPAASDDLRCQWRAVICCRAITAAGSQEVRTPRIAGASAVPRRRARAELYLPDLWRRDAQGR